MSANNYGISKEWAQAWEALKDNFPRPEPISTQLDKIIVDVTTLTLHLLAALMEAEFKREHTHCRAKQIVMLNPDRTFIEWYNGNESCYDPRHNNDHDAWLAAARRKMEELGR